jgi:hypothetical protein
MWDERRAEALTMEKARPRSGSSPTGRSRETRYEIVEDGEVLRLADAQWADRDADGRLLVATTDGKLQVRDYSKRSLSVRSEVDLRALMPSPSPPPQEAHRW